MVVEPISIPLVSVIIPCYNQGRFLAEAIGSVVCQSYKNVEVIVVDDGSTDNTSVVAAQFPAARYVYRQNGGLSAARNTGIEQSSGEFLLFLDADDWLLDNALAINVKYLEADKELAFVSGEHIKTNERKQVIGQLGTELPETNHYAALLVYNYIEMHATVMYRRWVFDHFRFDTALRACEDYDLYLKVARRFPIFHHKELIAAYRRHDTNMSVNIPLMIRSGLEVKHRQERLLRNKREKVQFKKGLAFWKRHYGRQLYWQLMENGRRPVKQEARVLFTYDKPYFFRYCLTKSMMNLKAYIKSHAPSFLLRLLHRSRLYKSYGTTLSKIDLGDLNRLTPFSTQFGYDRGGPVDRYYIENFLQQYAYLVKGRVLEIGDNEYTLRFGGNRVTQSDILHVNVQNNKATFVGDLSTAFHVPADAFDCIILTQTLHLIYTYKEAVQNCYRVLKPGGVLLLTVPGISHIDQGEWKDHWLWSFTESSIRMILAESFPAGSVQTASFGNVLVATAFLYGLGLPEIQKEQMDYHDPHYQVLITAAAFKPV